MPLALNKQPFSRRAHWRPSISQKFFSVPQNFHEKLSFHFCRHSFNRESTAITFASRSSVISVVVMMRLQVSRFFCWDLATGLSVLPSRSSICCISAFRGQVYRRRRPADTHAGDSGHLPKLNRLVGAQQRERRREHLYFRFYRYVLSIFGGLSDDLSFQLWRFCYSSGWSLISSASCCHIACTRSTRPWEKINFHRTCCFKNNFPPSESNSRLDQLDQRWAPQLDFVHDSLLRARRLLGLRIHAHWQSHVSGPQPLLLDLRDVVTRRVPPAGWIADVDCLKWQYHHDRRTYDEGAKGTCRAQWNLKLKINI